MNGRVRSAPALAVGLLVGCGIIGPERAEVDNRRPLDPVPAVYLEWHAEVEDCLGRTRAFGDIRWFIADALHFRGVPAGGIWSPPDRITMRVDRVSYEWAVKHEIIHYVEGEGNSIHGTGVFLRCGAYL